VPDPHVNELLVLTQPGHLQRYAGAELTPSERNVIRAQLVRERLPPSSASRSPTPKEGVGHERSGVAPRRPRRPNQPMHDKFTERVRKVIYLAREEAARLQHDYIGTEHLLLA
jgi:hypothetical protein